MTKAEIVEWLQREFEPLQLATSETTIAQQVDNALRYWNTHSAYRVVQMYNYSSPDMSVITLAPYFKSVVQVFPATQVTSAWQSHPYWSLLGTVVLDNVTSDMILLGASLNDYAVFLGGQLSWTFEMSENPDVGGKLYLRNMPKDSSRVCVVGARRVSHTENIKQEHILQWLLPYSKALLKIVEGNILRKADIIGVRNDGQSLVDEGVQEKKDLEEKLALEGRWLIFASTTGSK